MGFFKSVTKHLTHAVEMPFKVGKDIIHGDFNKIGHDTLGLLDRDYKSIAKDLGIGGWVGQHPLSFGAMVAATIFSGGTAMGAFGAGGAGAAGAAGGVGATGFGGALGGTGVAGAGAAAPITAAIGTSTAGVPVTYTAAQAAADGVGSSFLGSVGASMGKTMLANTVMGAMGGGQQQQQPQQLPGFNYGGGGLPNVSKGQPGYLTGNFNPQQSSIQTPNYDFASAASRFV